jgi:hypothetical protein
MNLWSILVAQDSAHVVIGPQPNGNQVFKLGTQEIKSLLIRDFNGLLQKGF